MPNLEVKPVETRAERRAFIDLLWDLYRDDPHWMPPLIMAQEELLGFRKHPFHERNRVKNFLAKRDGKVVGRITAIVNVGHNERYQEARGFFGFFECIDDVLVAKGLFDAASAWLRGEGMQFLRGPVNPSLNHDIGCLVEGFDSPPTFMMAHNLPYYEKLIVACGFEKCQDVFAYDAHVDMLTNLDPKIRFVIDEVKNRFNVVARPIDQSRFFEEVTTFLHIYNEALQNTWGFVPLTPSEVKFMAKGLKMLIDPDLTSFIEVNGKVVAAGFGLLDYNPIIKKIRGRLFPFGFLSLLMGRKKIKRARMMCTYVLPEWQRWGLALVLLDRMAPACLARGMTTAEYSWVLESNHLSRATIERAGAIRSKVYRIYDRPIPSGT